MTLEGESVDQRVFRTGRCVILNVEGIERGVWYTVEDCPVAKALVGRVDAAWSQNSCRCSSERCIVCWSRLKTGLLLSKVVGAMFVQMKMSVKMKQTAEGE
jgi:hypothetical protein